MQIPPTYSITNSMLTAIAKIEANRSIIGNTQLPDKILSHLRRQSLLKSSVFSAQIEGNTLSIEDIQDSNSTSSADFQHQEVENIITALSLLRENKPPDHIELQYILTLHQQVMYNLVHPSQTGKLRNEPSAIFDQLGNVVYMTPPPSQIQTLLSELLQMINYPEDIFPLIKAALAHLSFEKIHPFLDGNGRVGRLLLQTILNQHSYDFNGLLSVEEGLQERKQTYYTVLERNEANIFIEFILSVVLNESEKILVEIKELSQPAPEDFLLPRRREIVTIIREQKIISLDQLQRRFLKIPDRTLRYDLKQLENGGFIQKVGTTRGAMYQIKR